MTVKELLEKRATLGASIESVRKELPGEERDMTPEETQKWDGVNAEYDACCEQLEAAQSRSAEIAKRDARITQIEADAKKHGITAPRRAALDTGNPDEILKRAMRGWASMPHGYARSEDIEAARSIGLDLRSNLFNARLYDHSADTEIRTTQSSLSGESGGYLVQSPISSGRLENALKNYSGMREVSEIMRTETGADYVWPGNDDTANEGEMLAAPDTQASSQELAYTAKVWKAYEMSSKKIRVHRSLYQDSAFDVLAHVYDKIGERLGRLQNRKFTVGNSNGEPHGIIPCATGSVSAASTSLIAYDEMMDLEYSIDVDYRKQGCKYMANDTIWKVIRKLKDGTGNYLWKNGDGSQPSNFNGFPCVTNNNMATMAASAKTVCFGLLSMYKIREIQNISIQRFIETRGDYNQDEFLGILRSDGKLLTVGQTVVSVLVQHA